MAPPKNRADGLPLPDTEKTLRVLGALETRLGRQKVAAFLDPAFLLTAADARAVANFPAQGGLRRGDLKGIEALFQAESLTFDLDDSAGPLTLSVRSLRGDQRLSGLSKLPGLVPFLADAKFDAWKKQVLDAFQDAQSKGLYPTSAKPEQILNGLEAGLPDLAIQDRLLILADPQNPPPLAAPFIPYESDFGPTNISFAVLADHQKDPDVAARCEEWGAILKTLADDPWLRTLRQDPATLQARGLLDYRSENDLSNALTARQGSWSYHPNFEDSRVPGPLAYLPADPARALDIVAKIIPLNPKYAAMLSEPRAVLGLAGQAGYTPLHLLTPTDSDLVDLDRINEALLGEGMSLRPGVDFAQSGTLWLTYPSGAQTVSQSAPGQVDDSTLRPYDTRSGWMGLDAWLNLLNADGSAPRADRKKILSGLPALGADRQMRNPLHLELPIYSLSFEVPQGREKDPALAAWLTRTQDTLQAIYTGPQWAQLIAMPAFQQARNDRLIGLPHQLELIEPNPRKAPLREP